MALRKMPQRHSSKTLKPCCTEARREVMEKYGTHTDECATAPPDPKPCDCGYREMMDKFLRRSLAHDTD